MADILMKIDETIIPGIADAIRSKTGKSEPLSLPQMASEIESISGGGSDGIEGGYDVTFYDENNEIIAFTSVAQGKSVNAPNYKVKAWETEDGTVIQFPHTPTEDLILYANNDTQASVLYSHYGISIQEYPYVMISCDSLYQDTFYIVFAKTISNNTDTDLTATTTKYKMISKQTIDSFTLENMVSVFTKNTDTSLSTSSSRAYISGRYVCANFEVLHSSMKGFLRLDDEEETLPYDGLANGYDVMFYDENNEALAFTSVVQGKGINAPDYIVKAWETSDGTVIQFPYTPTEDMILYANNDTLAKVLYDHFNVDMQEYPYVLLESTGYISLWFFKSINTNTSSELRVNNVLVYAPVYCKLETTNAETIVNGVISKNPALSSEKTSLNVSLSTTGYFACNFELVKSAKGTFRLDE